MAENREEILDRLDTRLKQIAVASGFRTTVASTSVSRELVDYDRVPTDGFPFIACFPTPEGQKETEHLFGGRHEFLDVTIVAHAQALAQDAKTAGISDLTEDIVDAILGNTARGISSFATWGGYATETIKLSAPQTDEGVPEKGGVRGPTVTGVLRFRMDWFI